jgi:acid phosphatase
MLLRLLSAVARKSRRLGSHPSSRRKRFCLPLSLELLEDRCTPNGSMDPGVEALNQIDHFVVIYQENWSFDALYGSFPGANGTANASATSLNQLDRVTGNPLTTSLPIYPGQINDPNIPDNTTTDTPRPYNLGNFLSTDQKTSDIVHRFFQEQSQIDQGAMNKFITWSDNTQAVMSQFDATNLPEGLLAQQYTMDDNFFHAAFGGSFLNHQFLVSAAAPVYPNAPSSMIATLGPDGQLALNPSTGAIVHDGNITPIGGASFGDPGHTYNQNYAINTIFSANLSPDFLHTNNTASLLPSQNDSNPNDPTRPYIQTIGDSLDTAGVSWKYYAGGWDNALAASPSNPANNGVTGSPDNADPNFQWHHQPFAYYDNFSPWTRVDETDAGTGSGTTITYQLQNNNGGQPLPTAVDTGSIFAGSTHVADFVVQGNGTLKLTPVGSPSPSVVSGSLNFTTGVVTLNWSAAPGATSIYINYQLSSRNPVSAAHLQDENNFFTDLGNDNLPAVSFIKQIGENNEHPGYTDLLQGQQATADIVHAIQNSPDWAHTAIIITYDENGGRWDHVSAPDANGIWGDGTRVPTIVISPYAKQGFVDHTQHDTLSILKTVEQRFDLKPLNSLDAAASSLSNDFQLTPQVSIGSAYVQPDADHVGQFALIVQGTEGNDKISITKDNGEIHVQIDGKGVHYDHFFAQSISRIEIYGQGGNDHITVAADVTIPAFIFGGDGSDHIQAGGGATVIVGGDGHDVLKGGAGPTIIIGGQGHDILLAGSGPTILIGGTTNYDANIEALKALLTEWSRTDITYAQKVADLQTGVLGTTSNQTYALNTTTVHEDSGRDILVGGDSNADLFFAELGGKHKDHLFDVEPGETVIDL